MENVPISPYLQIADRIAARIQAGHYPPGTRLPSPADLAQDGHSVGVARDALRLLVQHGWAEVGPGGGYYVAGDSPSDEDIWVEVRQQFDAHLKRFQT